MRKTRSDKVIIDKKSIDITISKIKSGESNLKQESLLYNIGFKTLIKNIKLIYPTIEIKTLGQEHKVNHKFFNEINEISAYVLGLIASDGTVYSKDFSQRGNLWKIDLQKQDSHILKKINSLINKDKEIKTYQYRSNKQPLSRLVVFSKEQVEKLISLNIVPNKSLIYKIHDSLFKNHELFFHFLRGIFDGNGSLSYQQYTRKKTGETLKSFSLSIDGSEASCQQIASFLFENYNIGKGKIFNGKGCFRVRTHGNDQLCKLYHLLYKNSNDFYLTRKHNIWQQLLDQQSSQCS